MKISYQDAKVTVYESQLMQTTCTLIQFPDHLLLVDPNWLPQEVMHIANQVDKVRQGKMLYLLFTHSDYDHIIAYEKFRAAAELIVAKALLENPQQDLQLKEIKKFYDQYYLPAPWPIRYPQTASLVIAEERESHQLGSSTYHFFQAPGHNADGLITYLAEEEVLVVGDYLCTVEFPFVYHSIAAYQQTLAVLEKCLEQYPVRLLIGGHGPVATDKQEMFTRLAAANWYLQHLVAYGSAGVPFPEEELWQRYPDYPVSQGKYHQQNLELARKEFGS